jgi:dipeptidyl aminopeptidase/acylaminoacyl peptidase
VREGQRVQIVNWVTTLKGKRGSFVIRARIEHVEAGNGYHAGIGTWKFVRGTGQYAQVTGGGRVGNVWLEGGPWSERVTDQWDIDVMNADGSGLRRLTRNAANDGGPAWSPDGNAIAFLRNWMTSRRPSFRTALYVMDADGRHQRRLIRDRAGPPSWSPDGRKIAFDSDGENLRRQRRRRGAAEPYAQREGRLRGDVVARRPKDRVHERPRRQPRDLRHER